MRLRGPKGDEFALRVVGYQFPRIEDDTYDSNWLLVEISARVRGKSWTGRDPSLLTWELNRLIEWCEAIASGAEAAPEVGFLEPNLRFVRDDAPAERVRMRVFFELESRPQWAKSAVAGMDDLCATLECSTDELVLWAETMRKQAEPFPARAGVDASGRRR